MESLAIVQQSEDGELFTTSEAIAEGAGVEHRAVLQMIEKYRDKIEHRFGQVAFEMRTGYNNAKVRVAKLSEQQSSFVLTLARNTEQVVNFKADLVAEFDRMAKSLQHPSKLTREQQVAQALILSHEIIGELTADNAAKDKELSEARPKAQAWDDLVGSKGTWSFNEAAAALQEVGGIDIGRNRLFKRCGEWGYLYREGGVWLAKQRYRDKGLFEHKLRTSRDYDSGEVIARSPQVRITGKGLKEIRERLIPSGAPQLELEVTR